MERAIQSADSSGGGGSNSSSRSSSRATSAGSSPSCSLAGLGVAGRAAAGLGGGGSRSSPGSVAASPSGGGGRRREPALEGVLSKYTNLLQGWQNSVCKWCIHKMDHHCPWVNNCVIENNQKYFVLFTMYIALISLHSLIMVGFHFLHCFEEDWTKCSSFSPPTTVILLILLCFEALLFLIFTSVMFGTQVHSICTDEMGIEQLKKEERRWAKKTKWMNMKAVFGHPFSVGWASPFATPGQGKADPYQYVV